jgi:two-component system chemotaxis response regulator CheY
MALENLDNFTILIADDERLIQNLVCNVLTSLGFTKIITANNGRRALEYAAKTKFDFIISDWRMEDLDGIDIVRQLRNDRNCLNHTTPIIMLTGNTEAYYVKTAISAGINCYLLKPFSAEQLVKRIRTVIESPKDFIICKTYKGPDRRHTNMPPPKGIERRKAKTPKQTASGAL